MTIFLAAYFGFGVVVLVVAFVISRVTDKRLHSAAPSEVPPGFEATDELTIDPVDGKTRRVYFNRTTGERFYKEEARPS